MTPDVQRLCNRLAAAPAAFFLAVDPSQSPSVHVEAVVADLFRDRASRAAAEEELAPLRFPADADARKTARRYLSVVLVATWLLHDEAFAGAEATRLASLLAVTLRELSGLVLSRALVEDPDRREELVRLCLSELGIAPAGESAADAQDRLATLDSVRRTRLLREAKKREEVREQERKQKLEELRRQEEEAARQAARATHED